MILELHRRTGGGAILIPLRNIVSIFAGRYKGEEGSVVQLQQGKTYEVRETLAEIKSQMARAER